MNDEQDYVDQAISGSLADRAGRTSGATPDIAAVRRRAHRKQRMRRGTAGACAAVVLAGGAVGLLSRRADTPISATADDSVVPSAIQNTAMQNTSEDSTGACPAGQVRTGDGDVLLSGRPYRVVPGQCVAVTGEELPAPNPEVVACSTGVADSPSATATGTGTARPIGTVTAIANADEEKKASLDATGCGLVCAAAVPDGGAPCDVPPGACSVKVESTAGTATEDEPTVVTTPGCPELRTDCPEPEPPVITEVNDTPPPGRATMFCATSDRAGTGPNDPAPAPTVSTTTSVHPTTAA
jgi:hypothetical protein